MKQTHLTTICAILAVFGAGALQIAVAVATIQDEGVRAAFMIAIAAAIIMDALVIHQLGTSPSNAKQKGIALTMLIFLLLGLALDVVLLLTHTAFDNQTFGWMRALVGVNIAISLVLAAAFFAFSETNTHERQEKQMREQAERAQTKAFLGSPQAAALYRGITMRKILEQEARELGVPLSDLEHYLRLSLPSELAAPVGHVALPPDDQPEPETNGNHQHERFP